MPISGPPLTPNELAWLDAALGALHETPLTETEKFATVQALATISLGQVRLVTRDPSRGAHRGDSDPMPFEARLARSSRPRSTRRSTARSSATADLSSRRPGRPIRSRTRTSCSRVHRLLDGIESYMASRSGG